MEVEGREARLGHGIYMTLNLLYGYFSRSVSQQALGFLITSIPFPPVSLSRPHPAVLRNMFGQDSGEPMGRHG